MTSNKIKSMLLMSIPLLILLGAMSFVTGVLNAIFIVSISILLAAILIYIVSKAADLWYM